MSEAKVEIQPQVRVGVGVIIINRQNQVLLGYRLSDHGNGTWAFPGGHLEFGESVFDCAAREVEEETGMTLSQFKSGPYTQDYFEQTGKHYITVYALTDYDESQIPEVREADKCREWKWFDWEDIPVERFLALSNLIESGYSPFNG